MQCIAVVLVSVLALVVGSAVNYCGSRMCGNTNAHTFCQFSEIPSPQCIGYISAKLTIEEKSRIIARLNRRRNEAAAGWMRGLPTAGNMLKLRWVEELAREAQRWADQCRPPSTPEEHDVCRDLYSLSVGQCVASVVGEAPGLRIESMVDIWYMQSMLYKGNVTFYMPPSINGSFYGDFAQIIWARSYMVGCGRSRFMIPWQGRLRSVERLVCNIAPLGPQPTSPLWTPAAPAASCPPRARVDPYMTALCDYQRDYTNDITPIDASMTLKEHILLNTVLEIEYNETINYLGSLDEIYLTRVAIATLESTITTQLYYNSMQRRDVVESIDMTEATGKTSANAMQDKLISGPNGSLPLDIETTSIKFLKTAKMKLSLVGRPKTYNMEDLTDFDDKTENDTPIEEIPKTVKEFYEEYDFQETVEEKPTSPLDFTNTIEVPSVTNVIINEESRRESVTRLFQNSSVLYGEPINTTVGGDTIDSVMTNTSDINYFDSRNGTQDLGNASSVTKDIIDDYLSDPETVRQLQEALERMEHDMAPRPPEKQGKVRRELRDISKEGESATKIDKSLAVDLYNAEIERNKSIERGPMLNMVMKYMPYLKHYENGLLSKSNDEGSSSKAVFVCPSLVLVLTVCL